MRRDNLGVEFKCKRVWMKFGIKGWKKDRKKECWKNGEEALRLLVDSDLGGGPFVQIELWQSGNEKLIAGGRKLAAAAAAGDENES